ncbi:MAG: hypothetical protein GKR93_01590 [Gammaproteobacteria bacterium]|nr:hypothetical protein [Gammaproteobacteria bacterium]
MLELTDDGEGMVLDESTLGKSNGVGLTNTRERLQELYGTNHACTFSKAEPQGLKVNIQIPFEKEED